MTPRVVIWPLHIQICTHMSTCTRGHTHTSTITHLISLYLLLLTVCTFIFSACPLCFFLISCHFCPQRQRERDEASRQDCSRGRSMVLWGGSQSVLNIWRSWCAGMTVWLRNSDATSPDHEESSCKMPGAQMGKLWQVEEVFKERERRGRISQLLT